MPETKTETPADEMRRAVKTLRALPDFLTRPPRLAMGESDSMTALAFCEPDHLDGPQDCECAIGAEMGHYALAVLAGRLLSAREPLASWLESAARVAREHQQDPDYAGLPDTKFCTACNDEETTCVAFVDGALAVARVLNGGPS